MSESNREERYQAREIIVRGRWAKKTLDSLSKIGERRPKKDGVLSDGAWTKKITKGTSGGTKGFVAEEDEVKDQGTMTKKTLEERTS